MNRQLLLLLSFSLFETLAGLQFPPDFKVCKRSDPNLNECVAKAVKVFVQVFENGNTDFNFPPIDPLTSPSITVGAGAGAVHVVQNYKNTKLKGLKNLDITKARTTVSDTRFTIDIEGILDLLQFEADYDLNGQVMVLPISGTGDCTLKLKNVDLHITLTGEVSDKNGEKHGKATDVKLTILPKAGEYEFRNLFNGDERLGKEMNQLLNDNWSEIYADVEKGYEEAYATIFKDGANKIFEKMSFGEIFPA